MRIHALHCLVFLPFRRGRVSDSHGTPAVWRLRLQHPDRRRMAPDPRQRPYIDFPTTLLRIHFIKTPIRLFGVNWDANLYFSAIYACLTFLWMYWLMVRLSLGGWLREMAMAFVIECAAMLTLCLLRWYNDKALWVPAACFLLSAWPMRTSPDWRWWRLPTSCHWPYFSLMKPNMAGVTIGEGGCFFLYCLERFG